MKQYYTLLVRDNAKSPWGVHFGDFSRALVDAERRDVCEYEYHRTNTQIITTDETQAAIDAAIQLINTQELMRLLNERNAGRLRGE